MPTRSLTHRPLRRLTRPTTRMLGHARRPRHPNYLALACRALEEVIRIDKRLRPFMEEQKQWLDQCLLNREIDAALRKVYGDDYTARTPVQPPATPPIPSPRTILKEERALAKTRLLIDTLRAKLRNR